MRALLIAKPIALNEGVSGEIFHKAEELGLRIEGMKTMLLDVHELARKKNADDDELKEKQKALKVPAVLAVVRGENAIEILEKINKIYAGKVHVSANEEVAKYEIARFFKDDEMFEYEKADFEKAGAIEREPRFWRKYAGKSVEQIETEEKGKKQIKKK